MLEYFYDAVLRAEAQPERRAYGAFLAVGVAGLVPKVAQGRPQRIKLRFQPPRARVVCVRHGRGAAVTPGCVGCWLLTLPVCKQGGPEVGRDVERLERVRLARQVPAVIGHQLSRAQQLLCAGMAEDETGLFLLFNGQADSSFQTSAQGRIRVRVCRVTPGMEIGGCGNQMYADRWAILCDDAQGVPVRRGHQAGKLGHDNDELGERGGAAVRMGRMIVRLAVCRFLSRGGIVKKLVSISHLDFDATTEKFGCLLVVRGNGGNQVRQPVVFGKPLSTAFGRGDGKLELVGPGVRQQRAEDCVQELVLVDRRVFAARCDEQVRQGGEVRMPNRCAIRAHGEVQVARGKAGS